MIAVNVPRWNTWVTPRSACTELARERWVRLSPSSVTAAEVAWFMLPVDPGVRPVTRAWTRLRG